MISGRFLLFIKGFVVIKIDGKQIEKFLNISFKRGIRLFDIRFFTENSSSIKVCVQDFKKLRAPAKKSKSKVKIIKKSGLIFGVSRISSHKGFIFGLISFFVIFNLLASFIWQIDVNCEDKDLGSQVQNQVYQMGYYPGVVKYGIDTDKIRLSILNKNNNISWAWVSIKGTVLSLKLSKSRIPPSMVKKDEACDIISLKDGMIEKISVKDGMEAVKIGDTVQKGTVLVSGKIASRQEDVAPLVVHAQAQVLARTWYEEEVTTSFMEIMKIPTGNVNSKYSLKLFEKIFPVYGQVSKNEVFEKNSFSMKLGENFVLPVAILSESAGDYRILKRKLNKIDTIKKVLDIAFTKVHNRLSKHAIINKTNITYHIKNNSISLRLNAECTEEIGMEKKIGGN